MRIGFVIVGAALLLGGCGYHKHTKPYVPPPVQYQQQADVNCPKPGGARQQQIIAWAGALPNGKYQYRDATVRSRGGKVACKWEEEAGSRQ